MPRRRPRFPGHAPVEEQERRHLLESRVPHARGVLPLREPRLAESNRELAWRRPCNVVVGSESVDDGGRVGTGMATQPNASLNALTRSSTTRPIMSASASLQPFRLARFLYERVAPTTLATADVLFSAVSYMLMPATAVHRSWTSASRQRPT